MAEPTPLEKRLRMRESMIANHNLRAHATAEGFFEIEIVVGGRSPAERLARNDVYETWIHKYIAAHHKRLGFTKIEGPREVGPDFRVQHRGKWHPAEAEIDWKRYLRHKHHKSPAFAAVRFLIVLSESIPSADESAALPKIISIDRGHFGKWYENACAEYARKHQPGEKLTARVNLIAGAMQAHWVSICPDASRQMATCPDCNLCPYFGDGIAGEAAGMFQRMATDFAFAHCVRPGAAPGQQIDLTKVREADLRQFVELHGPF